MYASDLGILLKKSGFLRKSIPGANRSGDRKSQVESRGYLLRQKRAYAFNQQFVAFGVKVEFVRHKQLGARLAIGAEGDGPRVDKLHTYGVFGVILDKGIYGSFFLRLPPAGNARTQRDKYDFRAGQF